MAEVQILHEQNSVDYHKFNEVEVKQKYLFIEQKLCA